MNGMNDFRTPTIVHIPGIEKQENDSKDLFENADKLINELHSNDGVQTHDNLGKFLSAGGNLQDYNPYITDEELYKMRAKNQSGLEQAFNSFVMQGAVGIGLLGGLAAFGDLYDLLTFSTAKSITNDVLDGLDGEGKYSKGDTYMYRNAFTEQMKEWQDAINKNFQNYYDEPNKEYNMFNGGLVNSQWYLQNIPSTWSFLSFLIPSGAVVKGVSYLARGAKLAQGIAKGQKIAKEILAADKAYAAARAAQLASTAERTTEKVLNANRLLEADKLITLGNGAQNAQKWEQISHSVLGTYFANNMFARDIAYQHEAALREAFIDENVYNKALEDNPELQKYGDKETVIKVIANAAATRDWEWNILTAYPMYGLVTATNNWWKQGARQLTSRSLNEQKRLALQSLMNDTERSAAEKFNTSFRGKVTNFIKDTPWINGRWNQGALDGAIGNAINVGAEYGAQRVVDSALDKETEGNYLGRAFDAALWGLIGGIFSNALGSGVGKIFNNKQAQIDEKIREADILSWGVMTNNFIDRIQKYNNDVSPYYELDEHGDKKINPDYKPGGTEDKYLHRKFDNPAEKMLVLQQEYDNLVVNLAIQSMGMGNFDILQSFLRDDVIRQKMIDSGAITKEDAAQLYDRAARTFAEVEDVYSNAIKKTIDLGLNANLAQVIAEDETRTHFNINFYEQNIKWLDDKLNIYRQEHETDPDFDSLQYEKGARAYKRRTLLGMLNRLYTKYNYVKDKKGLDYELRKEQLESQIKLVEKEIGINDDALVDNKENHFLKYYAGIVTEYDEKGKPIVELATGKIRKNTELADKFIEEQRKNPALSEAEKNVLETVYQRDYNNMVDDSNWFSNKYGKDRGVLFSQTNEIIRSLEEKSKLAKNDEDYIKRAMLYWTTIDNEAKAQVEKAQNTIYDLMKKYDSNKVYDYLTNHVEQIEDEEKRVSIPDITDEDLANLDMAKELLGLNTKAYKSFVEKLFNLRDRLDYEKELEDLKKQREGNFGYTVEELLKINSDYAEYNKQRKTLIDSLDAKEITQEEYDAKLKELDEKYKDTIEKHDDYVNKALNADKYVRDENDVKYDSKHNKPKLKKNLNVAFEDKKGNILKGRIIDIEGKDVTIITPSNTRYKVTKDDVKYIIPKLKANTSPTSEEKKSSGTTAQPEKKSPTEEQEIGSDGFINDSENEGEESIFDDDNSSTGGLENALEVDRRVYCEDVDAYGTITKAEYDEEDNIVNYEVEYKDERGKKHKKHIEPDRIYDEKGGNRLVDDYGFINDIEENNDEENYNIEELGIDGAFKAIINNFINNPNPTDADVKVVIEAINDVKEENLYSQDDSAMTLEEQKDVLKELIEDHYNAMIKHSSVADFTRYVSLSVSVPEYSSVNGYIISDVYKKLALDLISDYIKKNGESNIKNAIVLDYVSILKYARENGASYNSILNCEKGLKIFSNYVTSLYTTDDAITIDGKKVLILTENVSDIVDVSDKDYINTSSNSIIKNTTHRFGLANWLEGNNTMSEVIKNAGKIKVERFINEKAKLDDSTEEIRLTLNGKVISSLPCPYYDAAKNIYTFINDGFIVDINHDQTDGFSECINLLNNWLSDADSNVFKILNEWASISKDRRDTQLSETAKEVIFKYMASDEWRELDEKGFTYKDRDIKNNGENSRSKIETVAMRQLNYMLKLLTYKSRTNTSLSDWVSKLNDTVSLFSAITKNPGNYEVSITGVNNGSLYFTSSEDKLPASKAIAGYKNAKERKNNVNPYRIGISITPASVRLGGIDNGATKDVPYSNANVGNTVVAFPIQANGFTPFVNAYGRPVSSIMRGKKNSDLYKIVDAIKTNLLKAIYNRISPNKNKQVEEQTSWNELVKIVSRTFYTIDELGNRTTTGLLRATNGANNKQLTARIYDDGIIISTTVDNLFIRIPRYRTMGGEKSTEIGDMVIVKFDDDAVLRHDSFYEAMKAEELIPEDQVTVEYIVNQIFETASIDINRTFIRDDGSKRKSYKNSYASFDENGNFVIEIKDVGSNKTTKFTYSSYSDFLLDTDGVELTTVPIEHKNGTKSNFITTDEESKQYNRKFNSLDVPSVYVSFKEKRQTPRRGTKSATETTSEAARKITESNSTHQGAEIAKLLIPNITTEFDILGELFPSTVELVNEQSEYYAETNVNTGHTKLFKDLIDAMNGTDYDKALVVKKLIHEQLHYLLHKDENSKKIEQIKEAYDEFLNVIKSGLRNENINKEELKKLLDKYGFDEKTYLDNLSKFIFDDNDHKTNESRYEEFLIEAITNNDLSEFLNIIKTSSTENSESIWSKLARWLIHDILGIKDVKADSLLEKTINLLNDKLDNSNKNSTFANETSSNPFAGGNPFAGLGKRSNIMGHSSVKDFAAQRNESIVPSKENYIKTFPSNVRPYVEKAIDEGFINLKCL